jgi:hypothetical protein
MLSVTVTAQLRLEYLNEKTITAQLRLKYLNQKQLENMIAG